MIFPDIGDKYFTDDDKDIKARMEAFYTDAITINQSYWNEADIDNRFYAGDQTLWNEIYGALPAHRSEQFNFNRIRRIVSMISGYQRKNRKSIIAVGVENSDTQTADQFTKILMWIAQQEGMLETISDAFEGALISGMNLLQVWVDYRSDPISGNIKVDNCAYNSYLIDPYFKKADLSDCNAIWKRSYLTRRELCSLLPDRAEEIVAVPGCDNRDGKFMFMPEARAYGPRNLLAYDEYYYRDTRKQKMLIDSQTGESLEWKSQYADRLDEFLRMYPQITLIEQEVPTVKVALLVQGKLMYDGPHVLGTDTYPFVPVFAYYKPEIPYFPWRIQGVVRGLRDAQFLYNRRKVIELDTLESQINSGWIAKENALVNPADTHLTGQGRTLWIKEEAQMTDVQQIQSPGIPQTTIELSMAMGKEMGEISGVSEEMVGTAADDKAGILAMLRTASGLTTLQGLFDQLDRSQKLLGKMILEVIQANFTPGKVKRIIEQEPTPQFYNKLFGKYDAAVEDGFNTTTQRQMQFAQLVYLKEAGVMIPDEALLEAATVQNKKELIEKIQKAAEAKSQMEQQQAQVAMQLQQAQIDLTKSTAESERGQGQERRSRVLSNVSMMEERRMEGLKDLEQANLNKVKALKELESMDFEHIEKLLMMAKLVSESEAATQQDIAANTPEIPKEITQPIAPMGDASLGGQQQPQGAM